MLVFFLHSTTLLSDGLLEPAGVQEVKLVK